MTSLFGNTIEEWSLIKRAMDEANLTPGQVARSLTDTASELVRERGLRMLAEAQLMRIRRVLELGEP